MQFQTLLIPSDEAGERLDQFLAKKLKRSRSQIQAFIKSGNVRLKQKTAKAGQKLKAGDRLAYRLLPQKEFELTPEALPLDILFEDKNFLVVNKAAGMVVHPDKTGHKSGTLANAVLAHCMSLSGGEKNRPGIVHRLDKDTSGALVIAKNPKTHQSLSRLFKARKVKKNYLALVKGILKTEEGSIKAPLKRHSGDRKKMSVNFQGKSASTHFKVLKTFPGLTLLEVNIETGRTHQIRVHLASIGHPVVGDPVYGDKKLNTYFKEKYGLVRQFLHAQKLSFLNKNFEAPLPKDLKRALERLS